MKNLVKGLLLVGAGVVAGYVISKHAENEEVVKENPEQESKKEEVVKKVVMIAGGIAVVSMMINRINDRNEISRLWDMTEINKMLWAKQLFENGLIDEDYKNSCIKECFNHINDVEFKKEIAKCMEVN